MTKTYLISSAIATLATAFVFTASLSSANAGWGENGKYGNAPGQTQSKVPAQTRPPNVPAQTGGYGGGSRPSDSWGGGRPSQRPAGTYGSESYQTNSYPSRRPGPYFPKRDTYVDDSRYMPNTTYDNRPSRGPVYVPSRQTYDERPNRGTVYIPPRRDTWGNGGGGYGGSQSSRPTSSNWNTSGGYGGR